MDSKKKEYVANRIFNSVFKSKAKEEWGVDLNLKINLDSDNYYDKWSYEFITLPSKFVLKNPNEDGWNEDRYWLINKVVKSILMEVLDYTGIYGNDTFPHKVMSTSYDDNNSNLQSRGPDQFVDSDIRTYNSEFGTNLPSFAVVEEVPAFLLFPISCLTAICEDEMGSDETKLKLCSFRLLQTSFQTIFLFLLV